jgi:neutral ceramidase
MRALHLLWIALAAWGCAAGRMRGAAEPATDLRKRSAAPLWAGAARADVTPPPGPSTFGHGPDSRVADGYWTRLYCRAFVLQTDPGDRVVLVPCELHSISALLHREVAQHVRHIVPTSRLLITATHTHAGPAHYFESPAYSGFASSRRPGFDALMVDFLATRIAGAVATAFAALRPAALRWTHAEAWKLTRNRSLDAYRANPSPLETEAPAGVELSDEEKAIDPALHILQLEAVDPDGGAGLLSPMGWLVFFAMHPTVVSPRNRLFGGDAYGVASRTLEAELRRKGMLRCRSAAGAACAGAAASDPLVALVNTNEGDVAPIWTTGSIEEAIRVGRALAGKAWTAHGEDRSEFRTSAVLDSRYLESHLPGAGLASEAGAGGPPRALCGAAELGAASGHGASDHPTSIDALLGEGTDVDWGRDDCHRPKKRMLGPLQSLMMGSSPFPTHAPLALLRVEETFVAFVPAEMTVQAGASLRKRLLETAGSVDGPTVAVIAGLANGYMQYVTTRREYEVQRYEGASTLYGPDVAEYLGQRFVLLARSIMGKGVELPPSEARFGEALAFEYRAPVQRARFPREDKEASPGQTDEMRGQLGLCSIPAPAPAAVCFWWSDRSPTQVPIGAGRWMALVDDATGFPVSVCNAQAPIARGEVCDPGAVVDDRGLDFQTRVRARAGDLWVWSSVLRLSGEEWTSLGRLGGVRIQAAGSATARAVQSQVFTPERFPPRCSDEAVRYCLGESGAEPH